MTIHREGTKILLLSGISLLLLNGLVRTYVSIQWLPLLFAIASLVFFLLILQFFRNPARPIPVADDKLVYAPADGKVVVIEETEEPEYFKDQRVQVSIFMSPLNVHVNRTPFSGEVTYVKYHPGKYLAAWHPKSSTENERATVVFRNGKQAVLLRQIAGAVARRIRTYVRVGDRRAQGEEFGFITFGSRVDVFLPLDAELKVAMGQTVKANVDVIARLP
ncbi:MAG: phosphatidylserine decarboxylase family protein [Bacteroidetes bacterium]|nr:MAG: phosphatidylserine decarboxylase family protein [Bacteroidota bacterium]